MYIQCSVPIYVVKCERLIFVVSFHPPLLHSVLIYMYVCLTCTACANGSTPVDCVADPCLSAECPGVQGARCVADYCEDCSARWFLGSQVVTEECSGKVSMTSCF